MTTYLLSTDGNDGDDGLTVATAWLTLSFAFANMESGDRLRILPGTYVGVSALGSEPPSGVSDSLRTIIESHPDYRGEVIIDGSDTPRCISLAGSSYITLRGLSFKNLRGALVGWSVTECVYIRDLNNTPGVGRNAHHIRITECNFLECTRRDEAIRGAVPLGITSFSDERQGHEACHHIEVDHCRFFESLSDFKDAGGNTIFAVSQLVVTGNVRDWYFHDNYFEHDFNTYREGNGGIEFVANYNQSPGNYTTHPDQPRKGIIRRNVFRQFGPIVSELVSELGNYCIRYAIYPNAVADVLIEQNFIHKWPLGIGLVTEDGSTVHNTMSKVLCRNNLIIETEQYGIVVGTWADNYLAPDSVWIVNNTITRSYVQANSFPVFSVIERNTTDSPVGVTGEYGIFNNLLECVDYVLLCEMELDPAKVDFNVWVSPVANAFRYPTYGTFTDLETVGIDPNGKHVDEEQMINITATKTEYRLGSHVKTQIARPGCDLNVKSYANGRGTNDVIPPWYVSGMFGAYETDIADEYDAKNNLRPEKGRSVGALEVVE